MSKIISSRNFLQMDRIETGLKKNVLFAWITTERIEVMDDDSCYYLFLLEDSIRIR